MPTFSIKVLNGDRTIKRKFKLEALWRAKSIATREMRRGRAGWIATAFVRDHSTGRTYRRDGVAEWSEFKPTDRCV